MNSRLLVFYTFLAHESWTNMVTPHSIHVCCYMSNPFKYMCAMFYVPSKRKIPSTNGTCMMSYERYDIFEGPSSTVSQFQSNFFWPNDLRVRNVNQHFQYGPGTLQKMTLVLIGKWPSLQETAPLKGKDKDVPNDYIIKNNGGTSSWFGSSPASSNSDNQSLLWDQLSSPYQYNVATATAFDLK